MKTNWKALATKRKKLQHGAELVEHALTLSFFLVMFFVLFEGIRLIYSFNSATYLVNDAVRYSIVRGSDADADDPDNHRADIPANVDSIKSYLKNNDFIALKNQDIDVTFVDAGSNEPGSRIRIAINYPFVPSLPMLEEWGFGITIPVVAEGVIVY